MLTIIFNLFTNTRWPYLRLFTIYRMEAINRWAVWYQFWFYNFDRIFDIFAPCPAISVVKPDHIWKVDVNKKSKLLENFNGQRTAFIIFSIMYAFQMTKRIHVHDWTEKSDVATSVSHNISGMGTPYIYLHNWTEKLDVGSLNVHFSTPRRYLILAA